MIKTFPTQYRALPSAVALILSLFAGLLSLEAQAATPSIGGYSPVSYFTENMAEKGNAEFSVIHKGKLYYLTSSEQVTQFGQSPDRYIPKYDVCPYSLALGKTVPLDPTNFKVIAGSLLLFHKSEAMDGLKLWNESELSDQELLDSAAKHYLDIKF